MATTEDTTTSHPLVAFVHALDHELDAVADVRTWSLDEDTTRELLVRLSRDPGPVG